jgi:hypothetical protein
MDIPGPRTVPSIMTVRLDLPGTLSLEYAEDLVLIECAVKNLYLVDEAIEKESTIVGAGW